MTAPTFKYDVAFSFLQEDEKIAYDLNDRLSDRLSTFIYSQKQKELAGTDGEKQFNDTFFKDARVVVVLYRNGWGTTKWTRIEETAIKNRAFETGWAFLLLVNLDTTSILPAWIPKPYIWHDYQRFKADSAAAVIEYKVTENGGVVRPETIKDVAERSARKKISEQERESFLQSLDAIRVAQDEVHRIMEKLKSIKEDLQDPASRTFYFEKQRTGDPPQYMFGDTDSGIFISFNNSSSFNYSAKSGLLRVIIGKMTGDFGFNEKEQVYKQTALKFDRDLVGNDGWSDKETGKNFLTSDQLIDHWVKEFLKTVDKRGKD